MDILSLIVGSLIGGSTVGLVSGLSAKRIIGELQTDVIEHQLEVKEANTRGLKLVGQLEAKETELTALKDNARLQLTQQREELTQEKETALQELRGQFAEEWAVYANQVNAQLNTYNNQVDALNTELQQQKQLTLNYLNGCQYYQMVIQKYNQALIEASKEIEFYRELSGLRGKGNQVVKENGSKNGEGSPLEEKGWISSGGIPAMMQGWKPLPTYPQEIKS